jgi:hypothetical protein
VKKNIIITSGLFPTNGMVTMSIYLFNIFNASKIIKKKYKVYLYIHTDDKIKKKIYNIYNLLINKTLNTNREIYFTNEINKDFSFLKENKNIKFFREESEYDKLNPVLVFPNSTSKFNNKLIGYIYDLQHIEFPKNFDKKEIIKRKSKIKKILNEYKVTLVNSKYTLNKIKSLYKFKTQLICIPFLPNLINYKKYSINIKKRFNIKNKFYLICNQFWKHKNYELAFQVFKILSKRNNFQLVCTGTKYNRLSNKIYFHSLIKNYKSLFDEKKIIILGNVNKKEQISLIRKSEAIIQPTLYEGGPGGFSTYEAIYFKKRVFLSDIEINKEIKNPYVKFFKKNKKKDLIRLILRKNKKKIKINKLDNDKKRINFFIHEILKKTELDKNN